MHTTKISCACCAQLSVTHFLTYTCVIRVWILQNQSWKLTTTHPEILYLHTEGRSPISKDNSCEGPLWLVSPVLKPLFS